MSFKEKDIRPADLLDTYLRLSETDGQKVTADKSQFFNRNCPGCNGRAARPAFDKNGFNLETCDTCQTLFVNPAPRMEAMAEFYTNSPSATYWAEVFFPAVSAARRDVIYKPRARRVLEIANTHGVRADKLTDVGAGAGLFLEEFAKQSSKTQLSAVEPGKAHVSQLEKRGFRTFEGFSQSASLAEGWASDADLVTCFEVLEHVSEPATLLQELQSLVRPGGLVIMSGLSGSGFDIQTLGVNAKPVSPPHHLTFLSVAGAKKLVARCGLALVDLTTPGELDVDIVRNAALENEQAVADPFIRNLVLSAPQGTRAHFQAFLKENALSSHMWLIARRPES